MRLLVDKKNGPIVIHIAGKHESEQADDLCRSVIAMTTSDFTLYEYMAEDWDGMLTPWPASGILGGRDFPGNAREMLSSLEETITSELGMGLLSSRPIYIAGYSLAGLFAMWSLCESKIFDGAVSASGSLWYPDWCQYIEGRNFTSNKRVYLSLGDKEPKTKNQVMSTVGECTQKTYDVLRDNPMVESVIFEWNEGGHFTNPMDRMAKGIAWIIDN